LPNNRRLLLDSFRETAYSPAIQSQSSGNPNLSRYKRYIEPEQRLEQNKLKKYVRDRKVIFPISKNNSSLFGS
jgi:hypothetical protein